MLLTVHIKTSQDTDKKVGVEVELQDVERKKASKMNREHVCKTGQSSAVRMISTHSLVKQNLRYI